MGGCKTRVSTTKLGHQFVITTLSRVLRQQYALVHESHSHHRLTLIIEQRNNNQDQTLTIT
jgi:hypothetical protein